MKTRRNPNTRAMRPDRSAESLPKWWTGDDDADRNIAAAGCLRVNSPCSSCRLVRCPLSLRCCRVCAEWQSSDGITGQCTRLSLARNLTNVCGMWRART